MISDLLTEEQYGVLADETVLNKTIQALEANGINVQVVETRDQARLKVMDIIPEKSEVMSMTSVTLQECGIADIIMSSGHYDSIRKRLLSMDSKSQAREMRQIAGTPQWAIGSVHAVTEQGRVLVASYSGSQMPAYVYGAENVVWVVGTQKIVKNFDEALRRIYEYVWPLEDKRAMAAYGQHSSVNKVMVINNEPVKGRTQILFVEEKLGF